MDEDGLEDLLHDETSSINLDDFDTDVVCLRSASEPVDSAFFLSDDTSCGKDALVIDRVRGVKNAEFLLPSTSLPIVDYQSSEDGSFEKAADTIKSDNVGEAESTVADSWRAALESVQSTEPHFTSNPSVFESIFMEDPLPIYNPNDKNTHLQTEEKDGESSFVGEIQFSILLPQAAFQSNLFV